ncbi:MAG: LapA family protein [Dethiobacteria bacterium]
MKAKVWIIIVIAILLLIILVQNTGPVTLNLFFWGITMPQILLLFFSIIIGLVIGYIIRLFSKKKRI